MPKSLGQVAYEAYREHSRGVSLASGQPLPEWPAMPLIIQNGWEAAADAIQETLLARVIEAVAVARDVLQRS